MKKINKNSIVAVMFIVIIVTISTSTYLQDGDKISIQLNNLKLQADKNNIIEKFEIVSDNYEKILNDNIAWKDTYIDIYGFTQRIINRKLVEDLNDDIKTVIKTKDDLISFKENKLDMEYKANNIIDFNNKLRDKKIPLLYVQAPFKITCQEDIPIGIQDFSNKNADELLEKLDNNGVNTIDLRKELFEGRDVRETYFITDHHWKIKSAFEAANYIYNKLSQEYNFEISERINNIENYNKNIMPEAFLGSTGKRVGKYYAGVDDFEYYTPKFNTKLKVNIIGNIFNGTFDNTIIKKELIEDKDIRTNRYACFFGGDYPIIEIENESDDAVDKKMLIIQDSYGLPFSAYMSLKVKETTILDLRYYKTSALDYIGKYNPDIVLILYNPSSLGANCNVMFDFMK